MNTNNPIVSSIVRLMDEYPSAKSERFKDHAVHQLVRDIRATFEQEESVRSRETVKVRASVGMGNWAVIPWIAFIDSRETTTTKSGVYAIILFRADMSGLYVTLNQGITDPMERFGRTAARTALRRRALAIRARFPELTKIGFDVSTGLDLRAQRNFTSGLDESTVAHRFVSRKDIESGNVVGLAVGSALDVYERYLTRPIALEIESDARRE